MSLGLAALGGTRIQLIVYMSTLTLGLCHLAQMETYIYATPVQAPDHCHSPLKGNGKAALSPQVVSTLYI